MVRLTVEADGGSRGNPGPAGYGAVVRDAATGAPLREIAASIGIATNNVAEYRGLIAGLQAVLDLDPQAQVEVRMDSKLVVEQMSGRWQIRHADMRVLAAEAAALVRRLPSVRFVHVPRERNRHADRLANEAMDAAAQGRVWRIAEAPHPAPDSAPDSAPASAQLAALPAASPWLGGRKTSLVAQLARHAATELTGEGRFCGVTDVPLSETGVAQASRLAEALAVSGVTAIIASPMLRCRQTAEPIAKRLGVEMELDEDLRETDFGTWEGLTLQEVARGWPDELDRWRAAPDHAPPTGESLTATAERVARAVDRARSAHLGRRILLVSHVTPIKLTVLRALGLGPEGVFRLHLDPAAVSTVHFFDDDFALLQSFNQTAHLI
ncbi:MAG: bifunctional RNase H/acid phosphatase [Mycobacteriales bacterium]